MIDRTLDVAQGSFELTRHPPRPRQPLRAWDAADEFVLDHVSEGGDLGELLVVNDAFGALATALGPHDPTLVIDGENARIATARNLAANQRPANPPISSFALSSGRVDTAVIKIPRSAGQLEDQLHRIRPMLYAESTIIAAGMARHIHTSTLELFESIIGPTTTSRAVRKARLVHTSYAADRAPLANPWPRRWTHDGLTVVSHGGVFSAERLDNGTRLLLANLPDVEPGATVVDLGCGNGVVAMAVARRHPDIALLFVDESHRALESSREGWSANFGDRPAEFAAADRLVNVLDAATVDLVITNPPFHEDRVAGDAVAWEFFVDAHAVLRPGGSLLVVGNQHLAHHAKLAKIFGGSTVLASNPKYVVLSARKA